LDGAKLPAALEIGAHGFGFDAPIALNDDRLCGLGKRNVLRRNMKNGGRNANPAEGYAETDQPS
jgi:hypothetical protein